MPIPAHEITHLLQKAFPGAEVTLEDMAGDSDHFRLTIASAAFSGKSRVEQHRMVYAALEGKVGGALHALALSTRAKT